MKKARIASLTSTMTAFIVADSFVPRVSMTPHSSTSSIGGRLNWPQ